MCQSLLFSYFSPSVYRSFPAALLFHCPCSLPPFIRPGLYFSSDWTLLKGVNIIIFLYVTLLFSSIYLPYFHLLYTNFHLLYSYAHLRIWCMSIYYIKLQRPFVCVSVCTPPSTGVGQRRSGQHWWCRGQQNVCMSIYSKTLQRLFVYLSVCTPPLFPTLPSDRNHTYSDRYGTDLNLKNVAPCIARKAGLIGTNLRNGTWAAWTRHFAYDKRQAQVQSVVQW